jgi:hypothetical protein
VNVIRNTSGFSILLISLTTLSCGDETRKSVSNRDIIPGVALVDDFEDGNTQILDNPEGVKGFAYTYDDRKDCREDFCCGSAATLTDTCATDDEAGCAGEMQPTPESMAFPMNDTSTVPASVTAATEAAGMEAANSTKAARIVGGSYGVWGAGMGITLNEDKAWALPADAVGLRFLALSVNGDVTMEVKLQDASSRPSEGLCIPNTACDEHQGCYADFLTTVTVTPQWQIHEVMFEDLAPPDFGRYQSGSPPDALDRSKVFQLQFQVPKSTDFDIWIDNVGFIVTGE